MEATQSNSQYRYVDKSIQQNVTTVSPVDALCDGQMDQQTEDGGVIPMCHAAYACITKKPTFKALKMLVIKKHYPATTFERPLMEIEPKRNIM